MTGARAAFHELMHEHNVKEEQVLYPATDRLLTEGERDDLVGSIQAFAAAPRIRMRVLARASKIRG